jgi:peptide/nickel transport system permease protein
VNIKKIIIGFNVLIFILFVFLAIFGEGVSPFSPYSQSLEESLGTPSLTHPFGQDDLGRDIMSRLFSGVRISFLVGFLTVFVSLFAGTIIGAISGYAGGYVDELLMRVIDILMAFPGLLLAIALTAILGPGLKNIVIALSALGWIDYARIVRGETLYLKETPFIESSRAIGTPAYKIIMRHIIPNLFSVLIVRASYGMGSAIIGEASLSFLGLGSTEGVSLGKMLNDGIEYLEIAPHLAFFPGIAIMLIILSTNIIGDYLNMKRLTMVKK